MKKSVKDRIAKIAIKRSADELSQRAHYVVVESFCEVNCKQVPNTGFCPVAERVYRRVLQALMELHSEHN